MYYRLTATCACMCVYTQLSGCLLQRHQGKTAAICFSCAELFCKYDSSESRTEHPFLFVLAAQKTLLLSDEAAHFVCWQRCRSPSTTPHPPPHNSLCQSAQLFTFSSCQRTFAVFAAAGKVWSWPSAPLIYVVRGLPQKNIKARPPHWLPAITGGLVSCVGLDCLPRMDFWEGVEDDEDDEDAAQEKRPKGDLEKKIK